MITVRNLHKRHGTAPVLNGVSLTVRCGEVAVLLGPSGGGKSTVLRCINGLEPFDAGEIHVEEIGLGPHPAAATTLQSLRRRVGMVFQQFHLFPHMSALQNVAAGPRYVLGRSRAKAEATARQFLGRVGLGEKVDAWPAQLSGGQQQRVAIARALALEPRAILFDEPTSALDPRMAAEVLSVIGDLAATGQTMIVVTHAMSFARRLAHRVHVMHDGRIVESGPPDQVFSAPEQQTTREFLAQACD